MLFENVLYKLSLAIPPDYEVKYEKEFSTSTAVSTCNMYFVSVSRCEEFETVQLLSTFEDFAGSFMLEKVSREIFYCYSDELDQAYAIYPFCAFRVSKVNALLFELIVYDVNLICFFICTNIIASRE